MKSKFKNINDIISSSIIPIILSILARFYYYSIYVYSSYVDTHTYIDAGKNLLNGHVDVMRTPIYPLFLQICLKILPSSIAKTGIVIIQTSIFVTSIFLFHKICNHFIKNKYIVFFTCLAYGCIPSIVNWEFCALTESFSIVSIVIFFYLIISYLEKKSTKYIIIASFYMFLMVMLRPGFIYIYAVFIGFLVLNFILTKTERVKMATGLFTTIISLSLIFGYVQINKIQNHVNGISIVTDINNFFIAVISNIYIYGSDIELVQSVDEMIINGQDPGGAAYETELKYRSYDPVNRIGTFNSEVIQKNKFKYLAYTFSKFKNLYNLPINEKYAAITDNYSDLAPISDLFDLNINLFCVYFLLIIEIIIISMLWVRAKTPPWGNIGIFTIIFFQIFIAIVGAHNEFSRLISPILPLILIVIFKNIDILITNTTANEINTTF